MTSVWTVVASTVGGAIAVILALFAGGWLFGRYYRRQVSDFRVNLNRLREHHAEHGEEIARWQRRGCACGLAMLCVVLALIVTGSWVGLSVVLVLLLPVSMICGGIVTIKVRYYWHQPLLRRVQLVTGERAVLRGWVLVGAGVLLLLWLLSQALHAGIFLH